MTDQEWVTEFSKPGASWIDIVRRILAESQDKIKSLELENDARLTAIDLLGTTCKDFKTENNQYREKLISQRKALLEIKYISRDTIHYSSDTAALIRCGDIAQDELNQ